jgi:O-antigen ligase
VSLFPVSVILLVGWGALAFGAEYSWAYAPLLVFAVTVGLLGYRASPGSRSPAPALAFMLTVVFVGGVVQLVPLSPRVLATFSPANGAADYAQLYARATMQPVDGAKPLDPQARRPISIAPSRTVLGLWFLAAFGALLIGCARGISAEGPHKIAQAILGLALVVGLLELIQRASGSAVVYGIWYAPQSKEYHSAPFINRNHTAGWLLMALSLSAGYVGGNVASRLRGARLDWRSRILWMSSRGARQLLLAGFAIGVMAVGIVATASRSASICLAFVVVMFGMWATLRQASASRRLITAAYVVAVTFVAVSVGGLRILAQRFSGTTWSTVGGRLAIWQDTSRIVRDFPWTGTGLNTYGIAMLHYQTLKDGYLYIEAHNDYLQIAAEGGFLLGVPIIIALALFVREVWRRFRERADDTRTYWLRAGAVAGMCAIATQELSDFTLQMPGAAVLFVVLAAIAIHRPPQVRREHGPASSNARVP